MTSKKEVVLRVPSQSSSTTLAFPKKFAAAVTSLAKSKRESSEGATGSSQTAEGDKSSE